MRGRWGIGRMTMGCWTRDRESALTVLVETDLVGALAEALTADVEAVLSDDTTLVGADTAMVEKLNEIQCGQY